MMMSGGEQFQDWSANYRFFSRERVDVAKLFSVARQQVVAQLPADLPLVVALDDSLFRKRGRKIPGVAYQRDPLSPPFHVNFILGQRFLQISAALPAGTMPAPARLVPIDFCQCPTPQKPKQKATAEDWTQYRKLQQTMRLSWRGSQRLQKLRLALDNDPLSCQRHLVCVVDGSYTNRTVLKHLPPQTTLIGRLRKDAKLYYPPPPHPPNTRGRKPSYGELAPTPEALRQDDRVPYQLVTAWAAGKPHQFKIKTLAPLRWPTAGAQHELRLMVIAPLGYRPTKKSRLLYRQPAYIICTNPNLPLEQLLQFYLWRWEIEVNQRDEKHLLGASEAMVRNPNAITTVPAFIIFAYALLLLSARAVGGNAETIPDALPPPKWRKNEPRLRPSTQQLLNQLRAEIWGTFLGLQNFSGFVEQTRLNQKPENCYPHLPSAVCYVYN